MGRLLRDNGFSLKGTAKTLEGAQHPDRDAQFIYINEQVKAHQDVENVPGGSLYKIDGVTHAGPFVARPVECTEEVDLRDEQFIIGDSYRMFMEPWSWLNPCKTPPSS